MAPKKVVGAVNFICTSCQSEKLMSTRAARADDDKIYFEFICLDCDETNVIELMAILSQLYTKAFAPESKLTH